MDIGYLPWTKPAAFAQRPCIRDDNTGLTYGEFSERIDALAGQLSRSTSTTWPARAGRSVHRS
ncbi:MAG: hypothetical protein M3Q98_00015 [Actinomycetota bacterium]|nr:hypothetical protein [Actinomycetota bacterium]